MGRLGGLPMVLELVIRACSPAILLLPELPVLSAIIQNGLIAHYQSFVVHFRCFRVRAMLHVVISWSSVFVFQAP